jgi:cytochrome c-type biogenesis protein CcmE
MAKRRGSRVILVAGSIVILSGFGYLLYGGLGSNVVYFLTPSEIVAKGEKVIDSPVRLGAEVLPGSVKWNAEKLDLRFVMTDLKTQIEVHSTGAPPQMFRDGQGVVVEGKLGRDGVFQATNLMVKHSNEYKAPPAGHPQQNVGDLYRTLVREESK